MADMKAGGWAVIYLGRINVRSVGPHRRSAMVNFLYTERGISISNSMSDEEIEKLWRLHKGAAEVVPIEITSPGG